MDIVKIEDCSDFVAPDNAKAKEFMSPRNAPIKNLSIAHITIPPGTEVEKHYHLKSEEIYHVIYGTGEMYLDGEYKLMKAGEAVAIPTRTWHSIANPSDRDLKMIVTCAPPWDAADQVFEDAENPAP